jgi:hypothetical protein
MNTYLKIALIFLLAFGLTIITYKFTEEGLEKYNNHRHPRLTEIFVNKTGYDILFIGSSRTHTTIVPSVIDSIAAMTSYNAGMEGGGFLDFKMTFDGYLLNHPNPRFLFLTIDPTSFEQSKTVYNPVQYFPFVKRNSSIEKTFSSTGYRTFLIKNLPLFNFVYMDDYSKNNALAGLRGKSEIPDGEFQDKGYLSNSYDCVDPVKYRKDSIVLSPVANCLNMFQAIIDSCRNRNIKLVITYAPEYRYHFQKSIKNFEAFTDLLYGKVNANRLLFYRDDSLSMNTDSCLFRDVRHVNTPGAIAYSKILGQRIKSLKN